MSLATRALIEKVRAPRFALRGEMYVEAKTIGTDIAYKLTTENVSRSGFLLNWHRQTQIPFIVNTILELTIDPRGDFLNTPVFCLGKVVRRDEANSDDDPTSFGIQIIQMDLQDTTVWESNISRLEKEFNAHLSDEEQTEFRKTLVGKKH